MKRLLLILFTILISTATFAQDNHGGGYFNPDSLIEVTVSGTAIVDSAYIHPMYYIDEDNDNIADYHLSFGPFWYEPDSSMAARPQTGEQITITGGLHSYDIDSTLSTIVVYEINGEFWREPFESFWNNMGGHSMGGGHHKHGGCGGYVFGFQHDSLQVVELSGNTIIDSTFIMLHYYMDTNNDSIPNYFLNFGPPWYEPASGAVRPNDGDAVNIVGALVNDSTDTPMIIVYELNGQVWRDSQFVHNNIGGWITKTMTGSRTIHNPFDENDWMEFSPGWHGGGMMMPDSIFVQMMELFPESVPNAGDQNHFAGYETGFFFPNGQNGMGMFGGCGSMMNFNNEAQMQLHYSDIQLEGNSFDETTIKIKYWDEQSSSWMQIDDAVVNTNSNSVSFSISDISPYLILTADAATSVESEKEIIKGFTLYQNYPNPFNPTTEIKFNLKSVTNVELTVYNSIGERVTQLINQSLDAGIHKINFNASNLSSGIYFYKLKTNDFSQTRKMLLIK